MLEYKFYKINRIALYNGVEGFEEGVISGPFRRSSRVESPN